MLPGRPNLLKTGTSRVTATITKPKYEVNVNTIVHEAAETLSLNAIGACNISLDRAVPFEAYADNPDLGGFILIDRMSNRTVAAGMILIALIRRQNIHATSVDSPREAHAAQQNPQQNLLRFTTRHTPGKSHPPHRFP